MEIDLKCKYLFNQINLQLNQPFFFAFTSGEVFILGDSSFLPLIIIKGTMAHKAKNKTQNKIMFIEFCINKFILKSTK